MSVLKNVCTILLFIGFVVCTSIYEYRKYKRKREKRMEAEYKE